MEQAVAALEGLLHSPALKILSPGSRYAALLIEAIRAADVKGNLVFDAQIAALCREHRVSQLLTMDRDFTRFPGLQLLRLDEPIPPQ
jgi:hypothetical protein